MVGLAHAYCPTRGAAARSLTSGVPCCDRMQHRCITGIGTARGCALADAAVAAADAVISAGVEQFRRRDVGNQADVVLPLQPSGLPRQANGIQGPQAR